MANNGHMVGCGLMTITGKYMISHSIYNPFLLDFKESLNIFSVSTTLFFFY